MVTRALQLANMPLDANDIFDRAQTWTNELFTIVPLDSLVECFELAKTRHDSAFAINCYEVLSAWRLIQDMREAKQQRNANNIPKPCDLPHLEDEDPPLVELGSPSKGYVKMPCPNCRPLAFRQRQSDLARRQQDDKATLNERLEELQEVRGKLLQFKDEPIDLVCSVCGIAYPHAKQSRIMQQCNCGNGILVPADSLSVQL